MKHEHVSYFIARAVKVNVDLHKTFHKGAKPMDKFGTQSTFFLLALEAISRRLYVVADFIFCPHQSIVIFSMYV